MRSDHNVCMVGDDGVRVCDDRGQAFCSRCRACRCAVATPRLSARRSKSNMTGCCVGSCSRSQQRAPSASRDASFCSTIPMMVRAAARRPRPWRRERAAARPAMVGAASVSPRCPPDSRASPRIGGEACEGAPPIFAGIERPKNASCACDAPGGPCLGPVVDFLPELECGGNAVASGNSVGYDACTSFPALSDNVASIEITEPARSSHHCTASDPVGPTQTTICPLAPTSACSDGAACVPNGAAACIYAHSQLDCPIPYPKRHALYSGIECACHDVPDALCEDGLLVSYRLDACPGGGTQLLQSGAPTCFKVGPAIAFDLVFKNASAAEMPSRRVEPSG